MRWRRIAFWITFCTFALIVLALSWLWTADLGVFKPQLARFVTDKTGREFAIDGELHIDLGRHTTVIAEDVRFGNPEWADADDMVTMGRAEVRIDLWSLVAGPARVEFVDIDDTAVLLINPGDTAPNWELPVEPAPDEEDEGGPGIVFGVVDVDNLRFRIESVERDRPLNLTIGRLDQVYRDDGNLDLALDGTLDGRVVRVEGELGTWDALLAGKDVHFDVAAVLDTFELSAHGRIDDLASPVRPQFEFTASGPDIDDLTRLLGLGEEGEGDINLSGKLTPLDSERLLLRVEGNLGQSEIDALGEIADLQRFGNMQLKATASGPDLGRVLRLVGIHTVREAPFMVRINAETRDEALLVNEASMVFADTQLDGSARLPNFPSIDDAVISLKVEGPDIERFRYITGVPGAATGPFSIAGTLDVREDGVEVVDLQVTTALGEIEADGTIGDPDNFYGSRIRFRVKSENLARMADAYGIEGLPAVAIRVSGRAEYSRDGIRTLEPVVADMAGNSANIEGLVPLTAGAVGADLEIAAEGPDLAALAGLFTDTDGIPSLPYSLGGGLRIEKQGYRLSDVTATLGKTALSGDGLLVAADNFAGSHFDVRANGPALEELVPSLDEVGVQDGPFELQAHASFTSDRVELQRVSFERPNARLDLDVSLGLPVSRRELDFDVKARGSDVRNVLRHVQGLEAYEQPFSLDAKGRLRGRHWEFEQVVGVLGTAHVEARGDLALDGSASRTELTFDMVMPNLAEIGTLGERRFNEQALSLTAHAVGTEDKLVVDKMTLRIGDSDVDGSMEWQNGDVPEFRIDVRSDRLIYLPLLEDAEEYDATPEFDDGRLIPDVHVPFADMTRVNGTLTAEIGEFRRGKLHLSEIDVDAELQDGALDVTTVYFRTLSGALRARASLVPDGTSGRASLQLVARDFAPGLLATNEDLAMTTNADIDLASTGADLRTLAGNANGTLYVDMRGGRMVVNEMITAIYGNTLEEMLNTINPIRKADAYTDLECLIAPLLVEDGKLAAAPSIFVSTETIRAVTQGWVDLKTEAIKVGVRTTPRQVVSISAAELFNPYLQVVGTLASPRLAVDEAGVLITGGAAVATGGLSLLARGLWDRLSRSGDACKQMSKQALETLEGRLPDLTVEIPKETE